MQGLRREEEDHSKDINAQKHFFVVKSIKFYGSYENFISDFGGDGGYRERKILIHA